MALFLIVAGFTGALLAFNQELLDLTQPWRVVEPPSASARLLDPFTLNRAALAAAPQGYKLESIRLDVTPRRAMMIWTSPPEGGELHSIGFAVDPYRGTVKQLGSDSIFVSWRNIMPLMYRLHYKLAIQNYGVWAFGIAALVWTIDCFVGFYLTLPVARRGWWRGWGKSWRVRWAAGGYRLNFDLHRAGGLWLWPVLLVFAWSSVGMNLRQVYDPVMRAFGAESMYEPVAPRVARPGFEPDWPDAYAKAKALVKAQGLHIAREGELNYNYEGDGVYGYQFATDHDFTDEDVWSGIYFLPNGKLIRTIIADGGLDDGGADKWFIALHRGEVGGYAYRAFESVVGLTIVTLSVTGIVVWMKKRAARIIRGRHGATPRRAAPVT